MNTEIASDLFETSPVLTFTDRWDHFLARCGVRRSAHRVKPGLYRLGSPDAKSPVFVTANYTLSFDALRGALRAQDGYILVLDTRGVNVWCAAGKGTFSTEELIHRIESTGLRDVVKHRVLILPQLGAPGIAAHEVKRRSHFKVEYGPVRAVDLPAYLETRQATPEMRRVKFPLVDRLVLVPVELVHYFLPMLVACVVFWMLLGPLAGWGVLAAFAAGLILFPALLPWLPTRQFSIKGFTLGILAAVPFAILVFFQAISRSLWVQIAQAALYLTAIPAVTAYLGLNFTGSTPLTSRTGVEREMARYIPVMAVLAGLSLVLTIGLVLYRFFGG